MSWKFYEDDGVTEDCYLEAFLPNVSIIDGNPVVMRIKRNSKKFSDKFKFEIEAFDGMAPIGEGLLFSDSIKDISELDEVLDELRFTIHKDFIYPSEEELKQLIFYELPQDIETSDYNNFFIYTEDDEVVTIYDTLRKIEDAIDMDYVVENMILQFFTSKEEAEKKAKELGLIGYTVETY